MALKGPQVAEAAAALLAAVGRGPAVDPLVGVQVPQLLEAPAALRAGVGTLTWGGGGLGLGLGLDTIIFLILT